MSQPHVSRRELIAVGVAAAALARAAQADLAERSWRLDFATLADGEGWPGWTCPGVATLRRSAGRGLLEAGSDVFPCDPRPVAFAVDRRFRDGTIEAELTAAGAGAGLVLRRTGHRDYLAAVYDSEQRALLILRRTPDGARELARATVATATTPMRLAFTAAASELTATLGPTTVRAVDDTPRRGDPGVLATARTLFPSEGPPVLPALGNLHLLPYGVQEGSAFLESPAGRAVLDGIRERSTAAFTAITITTTQPPRPTAPSVIAAGTGAPVTGGARVRLATDVPATVELEVATNRAFRNSRRTRVRSGATDALQATLGALPPGRRVYWRAHLHRRRTTTVGPTRSFRVLPRQGPVRLAIGSCASQFGPVFDRIAEARPDVFVWQGDLNYPDTMGPLAQTVPGYAGIWRDFLANPRLAPILDRTAFAVQRDDHDYGIQDANSTNLVPHGLAPWERLMERRTHYRFRAGAADVWVLDQRLHKSDPTAPDGPEKTLLGAAQRAWLLRTLAKSDAPYKVVCSPCTLAPLPANNRDGSWAGGFMHERDLLLEHIAANVSGQTVFVTGDTHWTMAYDTPQLVEVRPCPLGIPTPNDITITQPDVAEQARSEPGVVYADDNRGHVAILDVDEGLAIRLVDEAGVEVYRKEL